VVPANDAGSPTARAADANAGKADEPSKSPSIAGQARAPLPDPHATPDSMGDGHLAGTDRPGDASTDKGTADEHRLASAEATMLLPKASDNPTPLGLPRAALPLPLPLPRPQTAPRQPVVIALGGPPPATAPIEAPEATLADPNPLTDPAGKEARELAVTRPADPTAVDPTAHPTAVDPTAHPTTGPVAHDRDSATRPADAVALDMPPTTRSWGAPPTTAAFVTEERIVPTSMPANPVLMASAAEGMVSLEASPVHPRPEAPVALSRPASPRPAAAPPAANPSTHPSAAEAAARGAMASPEASTTPGPPGSPGSPGRSSAAGGLGGNKSDSDFDPVTKDDNFFFRDGKVVARDGRKVKTVRPHISEAGAMAIESMEQAICTVAFKIDETGKVVDVNILRSSGSNLIDHPIYLAAWKWEFEPLRDREGHAIPDVQIVRFIYH
jgi:TonB family protein